MSNLRIIELEQQLKRRDERLAEIETKVSYLLRYDLGYFGNEHYQIEHDVCGDYFKIKDVLNCFK